MASFSTEALALAASTRHCVVSSSKVLMLPELFKSGLGRMSVVGILLWHATKTWIIAGQVSTCMCWQLAKDLVPSRLTWPTHTYVITPNVHMARTGQSKNNRVVCEIKEVTNTVILAILETAATPWPRKCTKCAWCSCLLSLSLSTWASCQCLLAGVQTRRRGRWHPRDCCVNQHVKL